MSLSETSETSERIRSIDASWRRWLNLFDDVMRFKDGTYDLPDELKTKLLLYSEADLPRYATMVMERAIEAAADHLSITSVLSIDTETYLKHLLPDSYGFGLYSRIYWARAFRPLKVFRAVVANYSRDQPRETTGTTRLGGARD